MRWGISDRWHASDGASQKAAAVTVLKEPEAKTESKFYEELVASKPALIEEKVKLHGQLIEEFNLALLDRVSSTSYIAALSEDRRAGVLEEVRRLVAGFPERFSLPHRTDVFWCHRRSTP